MSKLITMTKDMFGRLIDGVRKFPRTLISFYVLGLLFVVLNHQSNQYLENNVIDRLVMVVTLLAFSFLNFELYIMGGRPVKFKTVLWTVGIGLVCGLYYFLIPQSYEPKFYASFGAILGVLIVSAIIMYDFEAQKLSTKAYELLAKAFTAFFYSVAIFVGVSMILSSLILLFSVRIDPVIFLDVFVLSITIFGVTFLLSGLDIKSKAIFPKVIRGLIVYITTPLVSIFTVVLYAFFIRTLITYDFSISFIASMTMVYLWISMGLLLAHRALSEDVTWSERFIKYFSYAIIIPALVLGVILISQVNRYGFTVPRFLGLASSLYFLLSIFVHVFWKGYKDKALLVMLGAVIFLSFIGPFSSFNLSFNSQSSRLQDTLSRLGILSKGELTPKTNLAWEDRQEVSSLILYLSRVGSLDKLSFFPKDFDMDKAEQYLGFELHRFYGYREEYRRLSHFYLYQDVSYIPISGFEHMIKLSRYDRIIPYTIDGIEIEKFENTITLKYDDLVSIDIAKYAELCIKNDVFEIDLVELKAKLIFQTISGLRGDGEIQVEHYEAFLLFSLDH